MLVNLICLFSFTGEHILRRGPRPDPTAAEHVESRPEKTLLVLGGPQDGVLPEQAVSECRITTSASGLCQRRARASDRSSGPSWNETQIVGRD